MECPKIMICHRENIFFSVEKLYCAEIAKTLLDPLSDMHMNYKMACIVQNTEVGICKYQLDMWDGFGLKFTFLHTKLC